MLKDQNFMTAAEESGIVQRMHQQVDQAFAFARQSEYPKAQDALQDVFVNGHSDVRALI
jgi:TPP-dependent pyruvate/acetoin dehydrogenase alpha subunit